MKLPFFIFLLVMTAHAQTFNGHGYIFIKTGMTFTEAHNLAKKYRGELVSVETKEEQVWIANTFLRGIDSCVWTSGRKNGKKWVWSNNFEINKSLFHPAEPNNLDKNEEIIAMYGGLRVKGLGGSLLDANEKHKWHSIIEIHGPKLR